MGELSFLFEMFPIPPSANRQTMPSRGRNIKTPEARVFDRIAQMYSMRQAKKFRENREALMPYLKDHVLRLDCYYVLHKPRVFTKTGGRAEYWVKQIDHLNFQKSATDAFCEALGIDDKFVFSGDHEKIYADKITDEQIIFKVSLMRPRSLDELRKGLGPT